MLHRQLFLHPSWRFQLGLGGQLQHQLIHAQVFADRIRAWGEVGFGYQPDCAREFAAGFVAPRLFDDVVGGEWRHAEALPQRRPKHPVVAGVALENDQHLAKGFRQHVDVADGSFLAVAGGQDCIQHFQGAHAIFRGDGVGQFIQGPLLGGEHNGLPVAQRYAVLGPDVEHKFLQFVGDHHHVAAEGVDQFASAVRIDLHWHAAAGAKLRNPADSFAFLHPRQFDDAAVLAHGFANALVAFFVLHLHAADVGGNADVVGDEYQEGVGIRVLAVVFDGSKFFFVRATAKKILHAAHEENLEGRHQRRGTGAVENFCKIGLRQVEFKKAEVAHVDWYKLLEDCVAETLSEEGFVAHEDVGRTQLARLELADKAIRLGKRPN